MWTRRRRQTAAENILCGLAHRRERQSGLGQDSSQPLTSTGRSCPVSMLRRTMPPSPGWGGLFRPYERLVRRVLTGPSSILPQSVLLNLILQSYARNRPPSPAGATDPFAVAAAREDRHRVCTLGSCHLTRLPRSREGSLSHFRPAADPAQAVPVCFSQEYSNVTSSHSAATVPHCPPDKATFPSSSPCTLGVLCPLPTCSGLCCTHMATWRVHPRPAPPPLVAIVSEKPQAARPRSPSIDTQYIMLSTLRVIPQASCISTPPTELSTTRPIRHPPRPLPLRRVLCHVQ